MLFLDGIALLIVGFSIFVGVFLVLYPFTFSQQARYWEGCEPGSFKDRLSRLSFRVLGLIWLSLGGFNGWLWLWKRGLFSSPPDSIYNTLPYLDWTPYVPWDQPLPPALINRSHRVCGLVGSANPM